MRWLSPFPSHLRLIFSSSSNLLFMPCTHSCAYVFVLYPVTTPARSAVISFVNPCRDSPLCDSSHPQNFSSASIIIATSRNHLACIWLFSPRTLPRQQGPVSHDLPLPPCHSQQSAVLKDVSESNRPLSPSRFSSNFQRFSELSTVRIYTPSGVPHSASTHRMFRPRGFSTVFSSRIHYRGRSSSHVLVASLHRT